MPLAQIVADFRRVYPGWLSEGRTESNLQAGDFLADIARETGR